MLIKLSVAAAAVSSVAAIALPAVASADASDDYPIPNRILKTTCTVDQYMAAARDVEPVYYEQMATHWGNWAKLFFNNKGVAAHSTDICAGYPPSDPGVWNW